MYLFLKVTPVWPPRWIVIHVMTTCCKGSTYHSHDLFSHGCVCWTDKYWRWWEPDAKFQMTSLCFLRKSQESPSICAPPRLSASLASFCPLLYVPRLHSLSERSSLSLTVNLKLSLMKGLLTPHPPPFTPVNPSLSSVHFSNSHFQCERLSSPTFCN